MRPVDVAVISACAGIMFGLGLPLLPPNSKLSSAKHEVTQADVDAFYAKKAEDETGRRWREYINWRSPETEHSPLRFPDVEIADPIMWDWYEHAVMRHERRLSYWSGETSFFYVPTSSTMVMTSSMPNGVTFCGQPVYSTMTTDFIQ